MRFETELYVEGCGTWLPAKPEPTAGAVAAGQYRDEDQESAGYETVAVAGADDAPPEMAARAADQALSRSRHGASELALLCHTYSHYQGYSFFSPASYIQQRIHARDACGINVDQMCNAGMAGLEVAASYLLASPARRAVMVTAGDRFSLPYFDRYSSDYGMVYGDAGGAVVLSRDVGFARIISSNTITVPTLEAMHRSGEPFRDGPLGERPLAVRARKKAFLTKYGRDYVRAESGRGLRRVVDTSLREADCGRGDIALFVLPNLGRKLLSDLYYPICETSPERTLWQLTRTTGHLGGGDMLVGLNHVLSNGLVGVGQRLMLVGAGGGYSFSAMVLEVVEQPRWSRELTIAF